MRILKFTVLLFGFLLLNACHVGRFFVWNFADINDHKKFPKIEVEKDSSYTFSFAKAINPRFFKKDGVRYKGKSASLADLIESQKTVAFLIIQRDTIIYEQYFKKYDSTSIVPSFSMAKSFTSALLGIAIAEGYISSVKDPIRKYIPELPEDPYGPISLEDLLDMRSGLLYKEQYFNPFGHVAKSYYGTNLRKFSAQLKAKSPTGEKFDYISVNTQLLGWAIENASGQKLPDYLEAKIWKPLGMEFDASWSIDSKKHQMAKAFCCLNARARDFAKFGRLYLNKGKWEGKEIIPQRWIEKSLGFDRSQSYSYQWWKRPNKDAANHFFAQGILGQFIYVDPDKELIMVRLGRKYGDIYWPSFFQQIAAKL
jgi:CubicO group peptidase (beta-lactamase class C family)